MSILVVLFATFFFVAQSYCREKHSKGEARSNFAAVVAPNGIDILLFGGTNT